METAPLEVAPPSGYGRARLWLGISAVGTLVTLSAAGLALDVPGRSQQALDPTLSGQLFGLLLFVLAYAAIQLPFDIAGGYLLPKRYGRDHPPLAAYAAGLARGAAVHGSLWFVAAAILLVAGRWGGVAATVGAGAAIGLLLLGLRVTLAALMAPLRLTPDTSAPPAAGGPLPVTLASSPDEAFTGSVVGVLRPGYHLLPAKWREVLGGEGFAVAAGRRQIAVEAGGWSRGRAVALLFTLAGLTAAGWLVGPDRLGTAGGTVAFSLWFSLWSFGGLLTLPTLSRRGVAEIDERARSEGQPAEELRRTARLLDGLQDGEPDRPALVEAVFHPIPNLQTRLDGPRAAGVVGYWDAARTTVYLSLAGLGLLGRAVHCNCGRPSLWVFLPAD
ncbi:MAG: hypothetical protein ACRC33_03900 [Gemmataceae bacterium]